MRFLPSARHLALTNRHSYCQIVLITRQSEFADSTGECFLLYRRNLLTSMHTVLAYYLKNYGPGALPVMAGSAGMENLDGTDHAFLHDYTVQVSRL